MSTTTCYLCTERGARHRTVFGENGGCGYRSQSLGARTRIQTQTHHVRACYRIVKLLCNNKCSRCRFSYVCQSMLLLRGLSWAPTHGTFRKGSTQTPYGPYERANALRPGRGGYPCGPCGAPAIPIYTGPKHTITCRLLTTQMKRATRPFRRGYCLSVPVFLWSIFRCRCPICLSGNQRGPNLYLVLLDLFVHIYKPCTRLASL